MTNISQVMENNMRNYRLCFKPLRRQPEITFQQNSKSTIQTLETITLNSRDDLSHINFMFHRAAARQNMKTIQTSFCMKQTFQK